MKRFRGMRKVLPFVFIAVGLLMLLVVYRTQETKILFVGDMFFDRHIRKAMYANGEDHVFSCIGDFLKQYDLVVGNLEGPVTESASVSLVSVPGSPENFRFTFPTNVPRLLYKNNIRLVNLGNNHISNFGRSGFESTKKLLTEAGVSYFGGFYSDSSKAETGEPIFRKENLSFVSYNEFGGESKEKIAEKIKKEKVDGQTVIVYTHWGEEYIAPPQRVKNAAKLFAESGASLVIGSHPHVIQESQILKIKDGEKDREVPIYYSLGNFIFDQYWNKEVSTGLALEVKIRGSGLDIIEHKVSIEKDGRTCIAN